MITFILCGGITIIDNELREKIRRLFETLVTFLTTPGENKEKAAKDLLDEMENICGRQTAIEAAAMLARDAIRHSSADPIVLSAVDAAVDFLSEKATNQEKTGKPETPTEEGEAPDESMRVI